MIPMDSDIMITFAVVALSIVGSGLGFSIGYYRARRRKDMEVRHAL